MPDHATEEPAGANSPENRGTANARPCLDRLAGDRVALDHELARLEEEQQELRQQLDLRDLAATIRDRWQRNVALTAELSALDPQTSVPADAAERLEAVKQRAARHQAGMERLHRRRQTLRREADELNVNQALGRHGARITATLEQDPWLRALESQIAELEKQREDLRARCSASTRRWVSAARPSRTACRISRRRPWCGCAILAAISASAGRSVRRSAARPRRPTTLPPACGNK